MIRKWTKFLEKIICRRSFLTRIYGSYYRDQVRQEVDLASIGQEDRILCIGGGSVPSTALELARLTQAQVHVIDRDREAVRRARNLIESQGLQDRISIYEEEGGAINAQAYDVIHIALQVEPKEGVVAQVLTSSREGSRIIIREPKTYLRAFYSQISQEFLSSLNVGLRRERLENRLSTMEGLTLLTKF